MLLWLITVTTTVTTASNTVVYWNNKLQVTYSPIWLPLLSAHRLCASGKGCRFNKKFKLPLSLLSKVSREAPPTCSGLLGIRNLQVLHLISSVSYCDVYCQMFFPFASGFLVYPENKLCEIPPPGEFHRAFPFFGSTWHHRSVLGSILPSFSLSAYTLLNSPGSPQILSVPWQKIASHPLPRLPGKKPSPSPLPPACWLSASAPSPA